MRTTNYLLIFLTMCLSVMLSCACTRQNKTQKEESWSSLLEAQTAEEQMQLSEADTLQAADAAYKDEMPDFTASGPVAAADEDAYEEIVDSPLGAVEHTLPAEDTMDYLLEKYRMPKWEWTEKTDGTVSYRGKTYKRNTYVKALLMLGIGSEDGLYYEPVYEKRYACDGIFLVAHDTAKNQISLLMIPRDTITEIYEYTEDGIFKGEYLNHLLLAYRMLPDPKDGCANTVGAVSKFLCKLQIDQSAVIGLNVLAEMTDRVGGVDVTVPNDELQKTNPTWTKGTKIHLTGEDVVKFLRYRDSSNPLPDDTPIIRMSQHQEYINGFYQAVKEKAKTDSNILTDLYEILEDEAVTTMTKGEILKLGADALSCDFSMEDITVVPGIEDHEGRNYTEFYGDYEQLIPLILELFYREVGS